MTWHYRPEDERRDDEAPIWEIQHYTVYMKIPDDLRDNISEQYTTHYITRNDLEKVKPGDVLWLVNVYHQQLFLLGRLRVELLIDDEAIAISLLDEPPTDPHEWFAIANKYEVEQWRLLNITQIASTLRFDSQVSPSLDMMDDLILAPQQLRAVRRLTKESAELLEDIWHNQPESVQDFIELTEDYQAYPEGKVVVRTVRERQRNRKLVNHAKSQFKRENKGRLFCEVCGFDFGAIYGIDYIEAHHTDPISDLEGETTNTVDAVVMLCANCHRAAHTKTPPYTVDGLKQMMQKRDV